MPEVTAGERRSMLREDSPEMRRQLAQMDSAQPPQDEPSYYDLSFLKKPVWKWQIAGYFFFGGLSAGAYILSRVAGRFGGKRYRDVARVGSQVAFASLLPCPPLLIHDLGDPKRFHHMLRIFKPSSPMSLGTWTMVSYSGAATAAVLREWLRDRRVRDELPGRRPTLLRQLADATVVAVTDAAGVPLAVLMAGYTGVLMSCTANPLWCKSMWIGPMFSASSLGSGASAIALALSRQYDPDSPQMKVLHRIDSFAHVVELSCLVAYLRERGQAAGPLIRGKQKFHTWGGIAGIVAAEVLKRLPVGAPARQYTSQAADVISLAAAISLRWAVVYGGQAAADDPRLARAATGTAHPEARAGEMAHPRKPHDYLSQDHERNVPVAAL
jgi:formate-dependent nitrite reductase membrane component NrfD